MKKTSVMLSDETRVQLEKFAKESGITVSDSIRILIQAGLKNCPSKNALNEKKQEGKGSLMLNEQLSIQAVLECLTLLRNMVRDKKTCEEISLKVGKKVSEGWVYID